MERPPVDETQFVPDRDARDAAAIAAPLPGAPAPALELTNGGLAPFGGGVPLRNADGEWLGAVGVSGGAVAQDTEIAHAAAAALARESIHS